MSIFDRLASLRDDLFDHLFVPLPSDEFLALERDLVDAEAAREVWEPAGVEADSKVPPAGDPSSSPFGPVQLWGYKSRNAESMPVPYWPTAKSSLVDSAPAASRMQPAPGRPHRHGQHGVGGSAPSNVVRDGADPLNERQLELLRQKLTEQ